MMEIRRGDLIEVHWVDIYEDSSGDPDDAELPPRISVGLFWGVRISRNLPCIVTTTTLDADGSSQCGYCIYPSHVVTKIKRIRKTRRKHVESSCVWTESPVEDSRVSERRGATGTYEPSGKGSRGGADLRRNHEEAASDSPEGEGKSESQPDLPAPR